MGENSPTTLHLRDLGYVQDVLLTSPVFPLSLTTSEGLSILHPHPLTS